MCTVNWGLVLEFVKAFAGPIATLGSATLVAIVGSNAYRRQKRFERRVEWYERMFRQLGISTDAFLEMSAAIKRQDAEGARKFGPQVGEENSKLTSLCAEALLYANEAGATAIAH